MDIKNFQVKEVTEVVILDPSTGQKTDVSVSLHGMYSDRFKPAYAELLKRNSSGDLDVEFMVEMTEGWKGLSSGGKPYKFTKANAKKLYKNAKPVFTQLKNAFFSGADFLANA